MVTGTSMWRSARRRTGLNAVVVLALAAAPAVAPPAASAAADPTPRVTVIGDSVQAAFNHSPAARRVLGTGLDLRVDARVCRRLMSTGCADRPEDALSLIRRRGRSLGPVVVMNIGYNDSAGGYDVGLVTEALRSAGVRSVVWVTLREVRPGYAAINARIREQARRDPLVRVADWNARSATAGGFAADGLHLGESAAVTLAGFLRPVVLDALGGLGYPIGLPRALSRRITLAHPAARLAADGAVVWVAGGTRLTAVDASTGTVRGRPADLPPGARLVADGTRAWIRDGATGRLSPPHGDGVAAIPVPRDASRVTAAGSALWFARSCTHRAACGPRAGLIGVGADGRPLGDWRLGGSLRALAADRSGLWLLLQPAGDRTSRLVRRTADRGTPIRSTRLPAPRGDRVLAVTTDAAWVSTVDGVIRVDREGRVVPIGGPVRSVVSDGTGALWVIQDGGLAYRLDAADGRRTLIARIPTEFRTPASVAVTGEGLWLAAQGAKGEVLLLRAR